VLLKVARVPHALLLCHSKLPKGPALFPWKLDHCYDMHDAATRLAGLVEGHRHAPLLGQTPSWHIGPGLDEPGKSMIQCVMVKRLGFPVRSFQTFRTFQLISLVAFSFALAELVAPSKGIGQTFIDLRDVKIEIEQAIKEAKRVSTSPPYFIIRKVSLTLQGERREVAGGGASFSIPVFAVGADLAAKASQTTLQKLKLDLIPPESQVVGGDKLFDLASLISSLKDTFKDSKGLSATAVEYTYRWSLQRSAEGKINVVVAKAGAEISEDKVQEIVFHLCQTHNRSDCIN
jgi:hypothetical protein